MFRKLTNLFDTLFGLSGCRLFFDSTYHTIVYRPRVLFLLTSMVFPAMSLAFPFLLICRLEASFSNSRR